MRGQIRVLSSDRGWQTLGREREKGIFPAAPTPTWDGWGPLALGFTIARDPSVPHPDLAAATPIEYIPPGGGDEPAWGGFIQDTPAAGDYGLAVNAIGHPFVLDDDPFNRVYVHENMGDWVDARTFPGIDLTRFLAGPTTNGNQMGWANGDVVPLNSIVGLILDFGPDSASWPIRAVVDLEQIGVSAAAFSVLCRCADTPIALTSGVAGTSYDDGFTAAGPGNGIQRGTFAHARRYVCIFLIRTGATLNPAAGDIILKIRSAKMFASTGYESGDASILKSSQIIAYALSRVPSLDQSTAEITATATSWPAFGAIGEDRTPRSEMEKANDLHRYLLRFTPRGRLQFQPRFARASLEVNTRRPGVAWVDSTVNSLDDVYNKVVVRATGAGGVPLVVTRLSSDVGISNVLDRRGRTRSKILEMQSRADTTAMTAMADAYLQRYARTPLKGTLSIRGRALKEVVSGRPVPAGMLGPRVGELVVLSNLADLDTAEHGRVGITVGAGYNEQNDEATIAIDNQRDDLDALLARLAVVSSDG